MLKKMFLSLALCTVAFSAGATSPEYEACFKAAQTDNEVALCMKAENTRMLKDIQQVYLNLSKHEKTKSWNNGNGLVSGNLKDMYNSWLAYRNRYCSLYQKASENTFGSDDFNRAKCLFDLNNDHLELMKRVIFNANSGSEESALDD